MKLIHSTFLIPLAATGICLAAFTVPWSTLDGGGGTSSGTTPAGKTLSISGTIGQFDATEAPSNGGSYNLNSGFWAEIVGSEDTDQPRLTIARHLNGDASLQWQNDAAGWQMETSSDLIHWTPQGGTITTAGILTISPIPSGSKRFYRLRYP